MIVKRVQLAGIFEDLARLRQQIADVTSGRIVEFVDIETMVTPSIHIPAPLVAGPDDGQGGALVRWLRPKVTIGLKDLNDVVIAPYGEPGSSLFPWIAGGAALGLWWLLRRRKR